MADLLTEESADPSPPLCWFDKMRLLAHGSLSLASESIVISVLAAPSPYNIDERLDWTLNTAKLLYTTNKFVIEGWSWWSEFLRTSFHSPWADRFILSGEMFMRIMTSSRFDKCPLLMIPRFKTDIFLNWSCRGQPNDHHLVFPYAPEHVPLNSRNTWDTYRFFRSNGLEYDVLVECSPDRRTPGLRPALIRTCFLIR